MIAEHSDDPAQVGCSRRGFCAVLGACLAATTLRGAAQTPSPTERTPDPQPLKLTETTRADMSPGKAVDYRKLGAFYLVADERGIFALTAICTHRGCLVLSEGPEGFGCPCHDSAYDLHGEVTEGPAKLPLRHLEVKETEPKGLLQVDISSTVPPETRL
jgi:nitrite reductase/ring-hydroxylating ferredoxin subunit